MLPHTITIRPGEFGRTGHPTREIEIRQDGHERPFRLTLSALKPLAEQLADLAPVLEEGVPAHLARLDAEILAAPDPEPVEEITEEELRRRCEEADREAQG